MNRWTILLLVGVGGVASLLFLRLVALELALQLKILAWRIKLQREQNKKREAEAEADEQDVVEFEALDPVAEAVESTAG